MDWQRIKEKVTDEVIRQLQADGVAATPEKVQQMVTQALEAKAAAPVAAAVVAPAAVKALPTCEVGEDFATDVLVVVAGPVCEQVVGAVKALAAEAKVTVVSSGYSERLAGLQACGRFVCEGNEATARRLVKGAGTVVAPVVSTSVAAKVGSLIGDCLASAVLVEAALSGKKVVVARESIAAPANAAWAIRRKVEEVLGALRAMGFLVTDIPGVVTAAKPGVARFGGGYVPAYTPSPAAKATVEAARATRFEAAATVGGDADRELAKYIDHTLLKPEATQEQITKLCDEAKEYHFMSVCINPNWVPLGAKLLKGTDVKVCTVIGFPLGAHSSTVKALETADAIAHGATEVDMVINVGALKSKQYDVVLEDIKAVVNAAKGKALTKVIIETGLLTDEEKVKACQLAQEAGADFVKTSTGFGPGGATAADIALMRKTVGPNMGVKASGGVRDYDGAMAMINAGATRIGASAGINIVKRVKSQPAGGKDKY